MKINVQSFWLYQITGWLTYYLVSLLQIFSSRMIYPKKFLYEFIEALFGFILTSLVRFYYRKLDFRSCTIYRLIGRIVFVSLIVSLLWYIILYLERRFVFFSNTARAFSDFGMAVNWITILSPIIFSWSALYFGLKFWLEWNNQKDKVDQANIIAKEACLQLLRYQINPHFLFNALNFIKALIGENDNNAKIMITELSEFLRYPLIHKNDKFVTLHEEVSSIKNYLSIEKRRYEENLLVEFDIDPRVNNYQILSFLLHPLLENAIKYGMKTSKMPLEVMLKAGESNGNLQITIVNTGTWFENGNNVNEDGTGTGWENVRLRLKHMYQDRFKLDHFDKDGKVYVILELKIIF